MDAVYLNEVRIGNILKRNDTLFVVGPSTYSKWDKFKDDLYPLELTEEILIKLGFKFVSSNKTGGLNYCNKEKDASIDVEFHIEADGTSLGEETLFYYRVYEKKKRTPVTTVHKLQNLHYGLTNEELPTLSFFMG